MYEQGADRLNGQLLQAIGLGDLVPASLQRWRPLIVEGVLFLLGRLPPPRQAAMLEAQRQLPPVLRAAVGRALQRVRQLTLPGFDWLVALLDDVASSTEAGFRHELILFRKAWLTLRGVIDDVAAGCPTDRVLLGAGVQRLIAELP